MRLAPKDGAARETQYLDFRVDPCRGHARRMGSLDGDRHARPFSRGSTRKLEPVAAPSATKWPDCRTTHCQSLPIWTTERSQQPSSSQSILRRGVGPVAAAVAADQQVHVTRRPMRPHRVAGIDRIGENLAFGTVDDEIVAAVAAERDLDPAALILDRDNLPVYGVDAVGAAVTGPLRQMDTVAPY